MATAKKLETLTQAQIDAQTEFKCLALDVSTATGPSNRELVIPAFKEIYKSLLNYNEPKYFVFVQSPMQANIILTMFANDTTDSHQTVTLENNDEFVKNIINSFDGEMKLNSSDFFSSEGCKSRVLYYYKYMRDVGGVRYQEKDNRILEAFETIVKNSGRYFLCDDTVIVCDRPSSIQIDSALLPDDSEYMVCEFSDGSKICSSFREY